MKVAKLVLVSLMTRVIVDENATDIEIMDASRENFREIINDSLYENIEEIMDDEEIPYGEGYQDELK